MHLLELGEDWICYGHLIVKLLRNLSLSIPQRKKNVMSFYGDKISYVFLIYKLLTSVYKKRHTCNVDQLQQIID